MDVVIVCVVCVAKNGSTNKEVGGLEPSTGGAQARATWALAPLAIG